MISFTTFYLRVENYIATPFNRIKRVISFYQVLQKLQIGQDYYHLLLIHREKAEAIGTIIPKKATDNNE